MAMGQKAMSQTEAYTYSGPCDVETRTFKVGRDYVLNKLFAAGSWSNLVTLEYYDTNKRKNDLEWVYHPLHPDHVKPSSYAAGRGLTILGARVEITVEKDKKIKLVGGLYRLAKPKGNLWVIVFSGSGGSPETYCAEIIKGYFKSPMNNYISGVLCVDYRGFGVSRHSTQTSPGDKYRPHPDYMPGSKALYTDAEATIAFLHNYGVAYNNMILHGYSLGSGPATEMARRHPGLGGLVLHGPMASSEYNAKMEAGALAGLVTKGTAGFQNIKKIKDVKIPICISCGPKDGGMWPQALLLKKECEKHKKSLTWLVHAGEHIRNEEQRVLGQDAMFYGPMSLRSAPKKAKYTGPKSVNAAAKLEEFLKKVSGVP